MNRKFHSLLLLLACFLMQDRTQTVVTITDDDLQDGIYNWIQDNVYVLDGLVYLEAGGVLNIQAGTVIKANYPPVSTSDFTSALIITPGARINAVGTATEPIIFTSNHDDLTTTDDLTALDNQYWGGVIILGNAPIGEDVNPNVGYPTEMIEGIIPTETRIRYGGTDHNDN